MGSGQPTAGSGALAAPPGCRQVPACMLTPGCCRYRCASGTRGTITGTKCGPSTCRAGCCCCCCCCGGGKGGGSSASLLCCFGAGAAGTRRAAASAAFCWPLAPPLLSLPPPPPAGACGAGTGHGGSGSAGIWGSSFFISGSWALLAAYFCRAAGMARQRRKGYTSSAAATSMHAAAMSVLGLHPGQKLCGDLPRCGAARIRCATAEAKQRWLAFIAASRPPRRCFLGASSTLSTRLRLVAPAPALTWVAGSAGGSCFPAAGCGRRQPEQRWRASGGCQAGWARLPPGPHLWCCCRRRRCLIVSRVPWREASMPWLLPRCSSQGASSGQPPTRVSAAVTPLYACCLEQHAAHRRSMPRGQLPGPARAFWAQSTAGPRHSALHGYPARTQSCGGGKGGSPVYGSSEPPRLRFGCPRHAGRAQELGLCWGAPQPGANRVATHLWHTGKPIRLVGWP